MAAEAERLALSYRCVPTTPDDLAALVRMLRAFPVHFGGLRCATLPGPPRPKARPRFNRRTGTTYVLKDERKAEERTRAMLADSGVRCSSGPVLVACLFAVPDLRRRDGDNIEKHLWDAAQGVLWSNDSEIVGHASFMFVDRRRPRTVVAVGDVA